MDKNKKQKGFTLIELVIYMGLAVMVLTIGINLMVTVTRGQAKAHMDQELYANGRLVINQITQKIRESDDVETGECAFGINPGVLQLDYPGSTTNVIFNTYTKNVLRGGVEVPITKLRVKEGISAYVDITSDDVDVTNFTLEILRREFERRNVGITLTLQSGDSEITLFSAASVRK